MKERDLSILLSYEELPPYDPSFAEKDLMLAVLRRAMEDIGKQGVEAREAVRFFNSQDDGYLFSFLSICDYLNICPHRLKRHLGIVENNPQDTPYPK